MSIPKCGHKKVLAHEARPEGRGHWTLFKSYHLPSLITLQNLVAQIFPSLCNAPAERVTLGIL